MCEVCDYIIFLIQRKFDLAMSQQKRDEVDTLNDLLVDAQIARWEAKESSSSAIDGADLPAEEAA